MVLSNILTKTSQMKFDFQLALDYLCNETSFRYCRLMDVVENNGCPSVQFKVNDSFIITDIPFLITGVIIAAFMSCVISFLKPVPLQFKKQRKTRAIILWRAHLLILGIYVLFWVLNYSVFSIDNEFSKYLLILKGATHNVAQTLLVFITLFDIQIIPNEYLWMDISSIGVSVVLGFLFFIEKAKSTAECTVILGFVYPLACSCFFLLGMIPVIIYRRQWKALVTMILAGILLIVPIFLEIYLNQTVCSKTSGWITSSTISVLCYGLYRFLIQIYFVELKKSEKYDGLPAVPKKIDDVSSSEMNKPNTIDFSDYSYSYTHSKGSEDV